MFRSEKITRVSLDFPEVDLVFKVNLLLHVTLAPYTDLNKDCVVLHFPFNFFALIRCIFDRNIQN